MQGIKCPMNALPDSPENILNCCAATTPLGRLIMNLPDIEKVCTETAGHNDCFSSG